MPTKKDQQKGRPEGESGKLTPKKASFLFQNERDQWRQKVRDEVGGHIHCDIEHPRLRGCLGPVKVFEEMLGIKLYPSDRVVDKVIIGTFRQKSITEARGTLTHEFVEVDYKIMSAEEKRQVRRIFSTIDWNRELDFFKGELYGASEGESSPYLAKNERENYCFWMVALRHESKERLDELKEINKDKFSFCKERTIANKTERLTEKVGKGESPRLC